jgi:hypothetical protein
MSKEIKEPVVDFFVRFSLFRRSFMGSQYSLCVGCRRVTMEQSASGVLDLLLSSVISKLGASDKVFPKTWELCALPARLIAFVSSIKMTETYPQLPSHATDLLNQRTPFLLLQSALRQPATHPPL